MRALVYAAPETMELQSIPDPSPGPGEMLVRVAAAGICGSDVHGYLGRSRIRVPPAIMGHELTGRIEALGDEVSGWTFGQRVVVQPTLGCGRCVSCRNGRSNICRQRRLIGGELPGGFAELVVVPERAAYSLPNELPDALGTLVEPLSNAVHMMGLGDQQPFEDVVVLGAGTLGLLTIVMAKLAGAAQIVVTDTDQRRLEVARRLGATLTLDAQAGSLATDILDATQGGAAVAFDAAGVTASRRSAIAAVRPGGTVVLLGNAEGESALPILDVINREIVVRGSYSCTDAEFRRAIAIAASGAVDASGWLEVTTLDRGPAVFERLATAPGDLIKVVFDLDRGFR